ncbi:MAG: MFS transporter [Planctomycetota bacterium]|nr:MFS transporter [Planctomycetota bacterium]
MTSSQADTEEQQGPQVLRALRHRNYRLFFGGQLVSLIGTFLTNTAMIWLAFTLTKSAGEKARLIGIVAFASQIPLFVLGPVAGVWVDRLDRRKVLVVTQTLSMLQSFVLAFLALRNVITVPQLIGLALLQGLINSLDIPARQAFLVEMVDDRQDLPNAIALNSTMVHGARLVGPAAAGIMIAWVGIGWCFLLDGISYIAVIIALVAMHIQPRPPRAMASALQEFREGFRYIIGFKPTRVLLTLLAIFSLSGVPAMMVMMPIFGAHFGGEKQGAIIFGSLTAASGFGALLGAIRLASRRTVLGLGRLIALSSIIYSVSIAIFASSTHLWLSLLVMPFAGWGMITSFASANTILQTIADDDKRGRVMSFFAMSFMGMLPFGVLISGELATRLSAGQDPIIGATRTIWIASAVCLAASIRFWIVLPEVRKIIRPIYVQRGIISEIAQGLQAAGAPVLTET